MNLAARCLDAWTSAPERPAILVPGAPPLSYGALDELSARFAAVLSSRGVQPGDRVIVQVDKSVGNVALYLAVLRLGAVFVPLNPMYTAAELAHFLTTAAPTVLVCRPEAQPEVAPLAQAHGVAHVLSMSTQLGPGLWADAARAAPHTPVVERAADDLAAIVFTSGTTGRSKGAMLTHGNLLHNATTLHALWGFTADDVLIHALPIFHVHGLFVALHTSWLNGTPVHFLDRFDAAEVRDLLPSATVLMGVPTFYTRLAALPGFGAADCRDMRLFVSGSAPLTQAMSDRWHALTGHRILERYGMSEAGMITSNPLDGERVAGTVGFPLPGTTLRIADGRGRPLPTGEVGTVEIRGPSLFSGYWRMPEQTDAAFREDGFFVTGDLGRVDDTSRVTLAGRATDLVISGGYNVYPKEVEQVLDAVPGVAESAVVGLPDDDLGEIVVAVLVAETEAVPRETLLEALRRSVARYKHPRHFSWVEALPRNAMGKVQKAVLRQRLQSS